MGYFQGKKLTKTLKNMEDGLVKAMANLDKKGGLINAWSFDEKGDILLFQEFECGCKKLINKIELNISKKEIAVLEEEEFVLQIEDMLLEINDSKGYDNLLFNIKDYQKIKSKCDKCA